MSFSPFPLALPAGEKEAASCGQGCAIPVRVDERFWSSLPPGPLVFLNLTALVKPAANDLQVGQCIRAGQWSNNSAECLLVLLLTVAWIFSVFLPLYHYFSLFSSVEAVTFLSLSLSLTCVCQESPSTLQTASSRATQLHRVSYPFYGQVDTLKNREIKGFVSHHSASLWQ